MNRSTLILIGASVLLSSLAQIVLKSGMSSASVLAAGVNGPGLALLRAVLGSASVWFGLTLYFGAAAVWLLVLAKVDVSLAYPFIGVGFVLTSLFAWLLRGETPTPSRIAGCLVICAGVMILARGEWASD